MHQPILDDKVRYYRKKVGKGSPARARLYPDRVEIVRRDGTPPENFPISEITGIKESPGTALWLNTGEQRHGLYFVVLPFVAVRGGGCRALGRRDAQGVGAGALADPSGQRPGTVGRPTQPGPTNQPTN